MSVQRKHPAGRLRSARRDYKEARPVWHILMPIGFLGFGFAVLTWGWTMIDRSEYGVAMFLVALFLVIGTGAALAILKRLIRVMALVLVVIISVFSGLKVLQEKGDKPWFPMLVTHEEKVEEIPQPSLLPSLTQSPTLSPRPTAMPSPSSPSISPSPPVTPSPSPELVYTQYGDTMLLKGGPRNLRILMGIYGYPGTRQVLDLEIQNLSKTEKVYFGSKFRPSSGVIEPNQTQRWQRINIDDLYLQTDNPPVMIRVSCVFAHAP